MSSIDNNLAVKATSDAVEIEDTKVDMNPQTNRLALAQMLGSEEFLVAETKLKRKLDIRLLGTMWLIFVLNYLDRVCYICYLIQNVAYELHIEQYCSRQSSWHFQKSALDIHTIFDGRCPSLCRLRLDANPL